MLREIFVPEWEEEKWGPGKHRNDGNRYLYWSPNIIQVIKPAKWYGRGMWSARSRKELCTKFWEGSQRQREENFECLGVHLGIRSFHPFVCFFTFLFISEVHFNTFAASYLNTQGLNNSRLKSPASTLFDLTFQLRALRSFSLNQLRNLSL